MLHRTLMLTLSLVALPAVLPAAGIPITGQVLGLDGEPRPKTHVVLEAILPTYERACLRLQGRAGPEPVDRTRTAADGTFELTAPEAGMWKVVVAAPGRLTMERRLVPLVEPADLPPVELVPAADLEVRMVDAADKPLPGRVGAYTLGVRNDVWRPLLRLARAGEDGVAHLPLGRGEKIQLELLADGHPLQVWEVFDESSVEIEVPAGVAGTVRITDRRKRPLPEAVAFQGSALLPLGLSDDEGRLAVVLAAEEPPALRVVTAQLWNGSFEPDLAAAGGEVKDLRLEPPATLRGRVLDLSDRDPVAGALVWAVRGELAVTDQHGRYELPIGVYKSRFVQALAAGYQKGRSQVHDASEEAPAIALTPAAALSGRVVDEDGGALEGVAVELAILPNSRQLSPAAQRMLRDGWRGRTSSRGAFRVVGLPSGIGYRLTFRAPGFAPLALDVAPLKSFESRSGIEAVLRPGRVAFGWVVDEGEVPIAGAEVRLEAPPPTDDLMAAMMMRRSFDDAASEPTWLTDAEGRFEIADLAAGRYDLAVRATGYAPAKVPGVRVDEAGGRVDFGTVVLVLGASIEGRVTDPDGAAVAGAEVAVDSGRQGFMMMRRGSSRQGQVETDAKGWFVVADLLPGQPVTLVVSKEGYGSQVASAVQPPTEEPIAVVLRPAGRLVGRVVDAQEEPIRGATVMAHPDRRDMTAVTLMRQRRPTWARTDADGRFLIENVEPGTLRVTADAKAYQNQVRSGVEVAAGEDRELDFVLETGAVVMGTLTTADGEPVAQASISVTQQHEGAYSGTGGDAGGQTDVEGRYRVEGVPTGSASISVRHAERRRLEKSVEIHPGTNVVDLVLERGFAVSGQVVAPDGTPMGGAAVSIQEAAQNTFTPFSFGSAQAVSGVDGTFTLTGVGAGKYAVIAKREGFAPASSEAFEVAGDVAGLLLELRRGATLEGRVLGLELEELAALALIAYSQQGGMRQGRVDYAGEYAFDNLAPGRWHIQAQVAGSGRSSMVQVEVAEGVTEVEKDIEFGSGFTLSGVVLDGGQPLAGAHLSAIGSMRSSGQGMTGADGRFRIEGLAAGRYQLMVMSGMGVQHMETFELAGDDELRIELATGSVSGIVRDATDGEPLAGAVLALEPLDAAEGLWPFQVGFGSGAESDSRGTFQLPRVRQGSWRVVATKPGYGPGEATVSVAGGAAPEVEIRMSPTAGVSFEVVLESGAAVSSVRVTILAPSGRRLAGGSHPVIAGKVRVSTVPPGRWHLVIQGGDSAATRVAVDSPGELGRFVLPTGGTLHIRVPELEEEPMASLVLTGPDGRPFVSTADIAMAPGAWMMSAGQSTVPGLVPGVWSFTVQHRDGRTWSGSAMVTAGETAEVSLP